MSQRVSRFSHVENLANGRLALGDPFAESRADGLVCRYDLRGLGSEILKPRVGARGALAWQALSPVLEGVADRAVLALESAPDFFPGHLRAAVAVRCHADMGFRLALPAAVANGRRTAVLVTPDMAEATAFLGYETGPSNRLAWAPAARRASVDQPGISFFEGSIQAFVEDRAVVAGADCSAWGNPYRIESLKLAGLELAWRLRGQRPTVLVADPSGEWTFALLLAAEQARAVSGEPPYRLVLTQNRPYDGLCRQFEGAEPDWAPLYGADNQTCLRPPPAVAAYIATELAAQRGAAVALDPTEPGEERLARAAALLLRTGFLDEDDYLAVIDGHSPGEVES